MINVFRKLFSDSGTPRTIRTDNGSCFKSNEYKKFCAGENIKRIRCTPNIQTGRGLVEMTIRTIKSLTRANLEDGLTFEESVQLAIKTIRQTPHSKLNMIPFQLHFGRKPRTEVTNMIGQPSWLLSSSLVKMKAPFVDPAFNFSERYHVSEMRCSSYLVEYFAKILRFLLSRVKSF